MHNVLKGNTVPSICDFADHLNRIKQSCFANVSQHSLQFPSLLLLMQRPVGYFSVDNLNASVQTDLVSTFLRLSANKGICIRNVTPERAA